MALTWRTGHQVLAILLVSAAARAAMAQQLYNHTDGYTCNGRNSTCDTFGLYRTFQANESLEKVAGYFFYVTPETVANLSGLSMLDTAAPTLPQGQPLYIPLSCSCQNGTSQMLVPQLLNIGNTFWLLSITIYGGFTQYQAMEAFNPTLDVYNLQIATTMQVPIFCACPTTAQLANGTNFLLTYTVYPNETLDVISGYFGITTAQLSAANELALDATLGVNTTLLVPLVSLPPMASLKFPKLMNPPLSPPQPTDPHREEKLVSSLGSPLGLLLLWASSLQGIGGEHRWTRNKITSTSWIPTLRCVCSLTKTSARQPRASAKVSCWEAVDLEPCTKALYLQVR
jgi:hypothetical protein